MALKAMNIKLEEQQIRDIKKMAAFMNLTMTELIRKAVDEYMEEVQRDPFYRLTANVEEASEQESGEILQAIEGLSEEDLQISQTRRFSV